MTIQPLSPSNLDQLLLFLLSLLFFFPLLIALRQHTLLRKQGRFLDILLDHSEKERELLRECYVEVGWELKDQIISVLLNEGDELTIIKSEISR